VLACALRPAVRYSGLTDEQWTRLRTVFPTGVCDFTRPGRDQTHAVAWASYESGAPVPLEPAP
jgi:hypothetical protein